MVLGPIGTTSLLVGPAQEIVFLLDFDQLIVDLHGAYQIAFMNTSTPEEFILFWGKSNQARFKSMIEKIY